MTLLLVFFCNRNAMRGIFSGGNGQDKGALTHFSLCFFRVKAFRNIYFSAELSKTPFNSVK